MVVTVCVYVILPVKNGTILNENDILEKMMICLKSSHNSQTIEIDFLKNK